MKTFKKLWRTHRKLAIAYAAVDGACSIALTVWFFSPWWPL